MVASPEPRPTTIQPATALSAQRDRWAAMFAANPHLYGTDPSQPAVAAADRFAEAGVTGVVELGAGQGRDTLYLARRGFRVHALDIVAGAVETIRARAAAAGLGGLVRADRHDVRDGLPFADASVGACYSHMLFCMTLTTPELHRLAGELRRVLRPGGLVVYTARTTEDVHYRAGIQWGDDMYEHGGFIVHFFDRDLVDRLAAGFELLDVSELTEGDLPRRLWCVTLRVPPSNRPPPRLAARPEASYQRQRPTMRGA
jgi:SAM-dependent methyltransferase